MTVIGCECCQDKARIGTKGITLDIGCVESTVDAVDTAERQRSITKRPETGPNGDHLPNRYQVAHHLDRYLD
jgi:hypothetical protein